MPVLGTGDSEFESRRPDIKIIYIMQTFRSQPSTGGQSDQNSDLPVKESKYVPYIPGETPLDAKSIPKDSGTTTVVNNTAQIAPENLLGETGQNSETLTSQKTSTSVPAAPISTPSTPPVYYTDPQYVYYPPMNMNAPRAVGMDPENFRKMLIGFFAVGLILFIILIIAFSGRTARHQLPPDIVVYQPQPNEKVDMPFSITGQARGYWFYDNAFPIILYDNTKTAIAYGTATTTAEIPNSEYEEFVPFSGTFDEYEFLPVKKKGYILFQRSTGNLETGRNSTVTLPIRFGEGTGVPIIAPVVPENNDDPDPTPVEVNVSATLECGDGIDNDGDNSIDMQDADCHSDENASNSTSYDRRYRENRRTITLPNPGDIGEGIINGFTGTHSGFITLYYPNQTEEPINPSCSKTFPVQRRLEAGNLGNVVEETIQSLISGPNEDELYEGFITGIKKGLTIQRLERSGTTLSIYFANNNLVGSIAWCDITDIKSQINQTMQQFADIDNVRIYANGRLQ